MKEKAFYRQGLATSGVPRHMHNGYLRYILEGTQPGDFLMAILSNDLKEACARGDLENQQVLYQHVYFLYHFAPSNCWGSPEAVKSWIESHQIRRMGMEETGADPS